MMCYISNESGEGGLSRGVKIFDFRNGLMSKNVKKNKILVFWLEIGILN
jgi:hypothetical protein